MHVMWFGQSTERPGDQLCSACNKPVGAYRGGHWQDKGDQSRVANDSCRTNVSFIDAAGSDLERLDVSSSVPYYSAHASSAPTQPDVVSLALQTPDRGRCARFFAGIEH